MADRGSEFTPEETEAIRSVMRTPGAPLTCPRCGGRLVAAYPIGSASMGPYWEVRCEGCGGVTVVTDLPRDRRPTRPGPSS